jgi:hypothetical protein
MLALDVAYAKLFYHNFFSLCRQISTQESDCEKKKKETRFQRTHKTPAAQKITLVAQERAVNIELFQLP